MSRIGKAPVALPAGVTISIEGSEVTAKGPKGELRQTLPPVITASLDDGVVTIGRNDDEKKSKALHGLMRSLVANMVEGVNAGYTKYLEIVGTGYRAVPQGDSSIQLQLGFSHSVTVDAPEGVTFNVPEATKVEVTGIDKQLVGQVAANIRALRPPEPYKGKGVRYRGEHVRRKAGKAGSS